MIIEEALERMKELGDSRAIVIWEKMGMDSSNYYGVNLTKLKTLAKEIKKNHELAIQLWETGIHDAKLLATMIEEPKKVTLDQVRTQSTDFAFWDLSDKYATNVIAKTEFAEKMITEWHKDSDQIRRRSAYIMLGELAKKNKKLQISFFEPFLTIIHESIQNEDNWAKEGMLYALMGIGSRNIILHRKATEIAHSVGKIVVDYGETSCVTPDPIKHLESERVLVKLANAND